MTQEHTHAYFNHIRSYAALREYGSLEGAVMPEEILRQFGPQPP